MARVDEGWALFDELPYKRLLRKKKALFYDLLEKKFFCEGTIGIFNTIVIMSAFSVHGIGPADHDSVAAIPDFALRDKQHLCPCIPCRYGGHDSCSAPSDGQDVRGYCFHIIRIAHVALPFESRYFSSEIRILQLFLRRGREIEPFRLCFP